MCPMNPRLLRPLASSVHPEANAWRTAVVANGGSVSASTMRAVSKFCADIDAAGIRDRFYRLNLFCGTGLNAALVPLYRNTSLAGSALGNATDTNNNFVSGDYADTGASGGLTGTGNNGVGAGNSKHLNTGLQPTAWPDISTFHVSAFVFGLNQTGPSQSSPIGIRNNGIPVNRWGFDYRQTGTQFHSGGNLSNSPLTPAVSTDQHLAVSRYSLVLSEGFVDGVSQYTNTTDITATLLARANPFMVFAQNTDTLAGAFFPYRMGGYSLGVSLSASQVLALRNAWAAFNLGTGRS
jgi:hypothetical protein